MSSHTQPRPLLACLALLSLMLAPSVSRGEEETRRVSLHVLSMDSAGMDHLFIRSGDAWVSLRAPATYVPDPVIYEGSSPLEIYCGRETDDPDSIEYVPVASGEIPQGLDDVLLLLRRRSEDSDLELVLVSLASDEFPRGSFLFFNHTPKTVEINLDDERMVLESRATRNFAPENREARNMKVNLVYAGDDENTSYVATTWFYRPSLRQLAVMVPEEDSSRFMVRVINLHQSDPGEE